MHGKRILFFLALCLMVGSCGGKLQLEAKVKTKVEVKKEVKVEEKKEEPPPPPPTMAELLTASVNGEHRPPEDKVRDPYRHPVETLLFFGLKKNMTILEIAPGQGWYTRIVAPVLREEGKLIVTSVDTEKDPESEATKAALAYATMLEEHKDLFGQVQIQIVQKDNRLGEPDSVDMVLSFRNNHFWAKAKRKEAKIYDAIFEVLKPGGAFAMVHHRANPDIKAYRALRKGYLPEQYVIDRAQAAGFELVEKSEINANPKDTKDYKLGVWSLPPVLARGEKKKEKYLEIGESDRMTLLFKKPGGTEAAVEKEEKIEEESATKDEASVDNTEQESTAKDEKSADNTEEESTAKDEKPADNTEQESTAKDEKSADKKEKS